MLKRQTCSSILMVRPSNFGFNEETAANNAFQVNDTSLSILEIQEKAVVEFDNFVKLLRSKDIEVVVVNDQEYPVKPDAVFPNNWVSFHKDGTVMTYPMFSKIRRKERREDVLNLLGKRFNIKHRLRLEDAEAMERYLEGTGSMVLDRVNQIAYACLSQRTDGTILETFCQLLGYKKQLFTAVDGNGKAIYHTNVMMAIGEDFVVICMDSIQDKEEKAALLKSFEATNKEVIAISFDQMNAFAGNMLQVSNIHGKKYLVMSQSARDCLDNEQLDRLKKYTLILSAPLQVIETYGGGSARCMMAEIFLPLKGATENVMN